MMWNYFRWVLVVWGAAALLTKPVFFNLLGERWRSWLAQNAYHEGKRPAWILFAAVGSFLLIGYTWVRVYLDPVPYDWVVGVLMTVSAVKVLALLFDYGRFQSWVSELLADPVKERRMILQVSVVGVVLIVLGFWVY
jgi:hypothetical protein